MTGLMGAQQRMHEDNFVSALFIEPVFASIAIRD
jgi:hypothetical protein